MSTISLDVTGPRFMLVDTDRAYVDFVPPPRLTRELTVRARRVVLRFLGPPPPELRSLAADCRGMPHLEGWSTFVFRGPTHLDFSVSLYADPSGVDFARLPDGALHVVEAARSRLAAASGAGVAYPLGGVLLSPHGDAQLEVVAAGPVTLELDPAEARPPVTWRRPPPEWE